MVPKPDVIHSQAVLDTDRLVRASIREIMQKLTIVKFYELLRQTYPKDTPFTETFLEREYNRVGFHKIGFKLKYQYIVAALSEVAFEAKVCFFNHTSSLTYCLHRFLQLTSIALLGRNRQLRRQFYLTNQIT